jgi:NADH:ubiquinone oxidoreductase subunit E
MLLLRKAFKLINLIRSDNMITLTVCIGSSCHIKGSYDVVSALQNLINDNDLNDKVIIKASFCLGNCTKPVSVIVNNDPVLSVNKENIQEFFNENVLNKLKVKKEV